MRCSVNPLAGDPPTGEPDVGEPPVRFGGRGSESNRLSLPLLNSFPAGKTNSFAAGKQIHSLREKIIPCGKTKFHSLRENKFIPKREKRDLSA